MSELEKLREFFLSGVDEEEREANAAEIAKWEQGLIENEGMASWQEHDITKAIMKRAKEAYREHSFQLAFDRRMSQEYRNTLYARQDAILWLLALAEKDAKAEIDRIHAEIKTALNATN